MMIMRLKTSRFCRCWALILTFSMLRCKCLPLKGLYFGGNNLNLRKVDLPTGTVFINHRLIATARKKSQKRSLATDYFQLMDPRCPIHEGKAKQFRNVYLEDISNEDTRDRLQYLGYDKQRTNPKAEAITKSGWNPAWKFRKIGLGDLENKRKND